MSSLAQRDAALNKMILEGKALEAVEEFYADHCVMQENLDEPCHGKAKNLEREKQFLALIEAFHDAKLVSSAVGDGVSFSEWEFDVTLKGVGRNKSSQVARRLWQDGKVVHERFYHK